MRVENYDDFLIVDYQCVRGDDNSEQVDAVRDDNPTIAFAGAYCDYYTDANLDGKTVEQCEAYVKLTCPNSTYFINANTDNL